MLLAAELQAGQLQGAVESERAGQLAHLGETLLEIDVWHPRQQAFQVMSLPILQQLQTVVVTPADPALQLRTVG